MPAGGENKPTYSDWPFQPETKPVGSFLTAADIDADELLGGVGVKDRVDGMIAKYVDQYLLYDLNGLITKIAQQAIMLAYLIIYQDEDKPFQPGNRAKWPRCSGEHGLNVPDRIGLIARFVAKSMRLRAQRLMPGRVAYPHPHDLFMMWPHAPRVIKYLIEQDQEAKKAVATVVKLKSELTSSTRDSLIDGINPRSYRDAQPSSGDVSTVNKNVLTITKTRVAVQGGGDLTKEITVFKADNIVSNLELDPDGKVEERDISGNRIYETPKADICVSFESQLKPGTLENDEFMAKTGATFAISSVATTKEAPGRKGWRETDDATKIELHKAKKLHRTTLITADERHQIEFEMAPLHLQETGAATGVPRTVGCLKGQIEPTTHIPKGLLIIKKKIDGVSHRLEVANNTYSIFPRVIEGADFDVGMPYSSSGSASSDINLACDLEITKHKVFHVTRVYEINGVATSGLSAISAAVHSNLTISGLTRCDLENCTCPADGIVIDKDGVEKKYEDVISKDARSNETAYPVIVTVNNIQGNASQKIECVAFTKSTKAEKGGPDKFENPRRRNFPLYVQKKEDRNPAPLLPATPFLRKLLAGYYSVPYVLSKHLPYKGGSLPEYDSASGACHACGQLALASCECDHEFCVHHPCTSCSRWRFAPDSIVRPLKKVCIRCKRAPVVVCACENHVKQRTFCLSHFQRREHECEYFFTGTLPPEPENYSDSDDE